MASKEIGKHVLVPASMLEGLSSLSARTRVRQSDYLREAIADMLAKHGTADVVPQWPEIDESEKLESLVFRLPRAQHDALTALAKRTRIISSHWVRLAVDMLLKKHGDSGTERTCDCGCKAPLPPPAPVGRRRQYIDETHRKYHLKVLGATEAA